VGFVGTDLNNDKQSRGGERCGGGNSYHYGHVGHDQRFGEFDGDSTGSGVGIGESVNSSCAFRKRSAIYGDGNIYGREHAESEQCGELEFVGFECSQHQ
jgi:hypothetical protein